MRRVIATLLVVAGAVAAADQPGTRAILQPPNERKAAPDFVLRDSTGKMATLKKYRGKVVLLDFWATWCHGCKEEIPWFSEFAKTSSKKGLAVVGVSMDEGGWKVLEPFLAENHIPYRMVLGDDATAKGYGIDNLPDTFLIDRHGKIAAAYVAGMVDRGDVEENIKKMLEQR
ncbi:MAG TPA: TlpA disulfide reductase family protein [Bryobacteraceae bacterium]|nr:TlpA disulfide reductase family protein [Bryobacteraceae bacterium]